jgi:hypothetical protein
MKLAHYLPIVALLVMTGCGIPTGAGEFQKTPEALFLKSTFDKVSAGEYDGVISLLDDKIHQPDARDVLQRMRPLVPSEEPVKMQPVAWSFVSFKSLTNGGTSNSRTSDVAAEYDYPNGRHLVVSAKLSGTPGTFRLLAFNIESIPAPLSELNAFSLNKSPWQFVFLFLAVAAFAINLGAFVVCLRTKGLTLKWLWAIFTLIGVVGFSLNWTNGAVYVDPLHFNLFSAAVARNGWVGPWAVTFCIPFGAIAFFVKRQRMIKLQRSASGAVLNDAESASANSEAG